MSCLCYKQREFLNGPPDDDLPSVKFQVRSSRISTVVVSGACVWMLFVAVVLLGFDLVGVVMQKEKRRDGHGSYRLL
jgi:hypothetical protein